MVEINFLAGSKYLLPRVKIDSKTNILGSKILCIIAHLPSVQAVVRFKTKQNPIWSMTIWNYV